MTIRIGAKIIAGSAVAAMLGVGLCATTPFDSNSWKVSAGILLMLGGGIGFLVGCVVALVQLVQRKR